MSAPDGFRSGQQAFCTECGPLGFIWTIAALYFTRAAITNAAGQFEFVERTTLRPVRRDLRLVAVNGRIIDRQPIEARA